MLEKERLLPGGVSPSWKEPLLPKEGLLQKEGFSGDSPLL
jgi:hypothetical protein